MRRFEFVDTKSAKFWEIERQGVEVRTRWGRIGTDGQRTIKDCFTIAMAEAEIVKQIGSKTAKGYVETGDGVAPAPSTARAPAAARPAATAKASAAAAPAVATAPGSTAPLDDLLDGQQTTVAGSGSSTYVLRNAGGVYSCSCPAWRNQSAAIDRRTCKHLRRFRGEAAEEARLGALPVRAIRSGGGGSASTANAPPLLLAHRWEQQDPTGWWLSEKLDGVRAYWDGKRFISRLGNQYVAPPWFVADLPDFPLDGELFAGRGRFQHAVSVARRSDAGEAWRTLAFVIFDAPAHDGGFEDRLAHLDDHFASRTSPLARVLPHRACLGHDDVKAELARIEALGGEGLMLRRPGSRYEVGRSQTLLKVKSFFDTEARIIGYQAGTGRHKGRLGALELELPNGTRFKVGTGMSDAERETPPAIGEVITVRYQELTDAGVPRFPSYIGPRADASWALLVAAEANKSNG